MFNPIIVPVRNNLSLTKKAIRTFKAQDIGDVSILVINNASTDGTTEYLGTERDIYQMYYDPPLSVAASWNRALNFFFIAGAEYALVVNNDVELQPQTYRYLVGDGGGFVTCIGNQQWPEVINPPDPEKKRAHPDFSCYLIRKEVYEKVGPFDEQFLIAFGEDWDYHVRLHRSGIAAMAIDFPFLHHGSMTIKNADLSEIRKIQMQAEKNRMYFKKKWGMAGASEEYYRYFNNEAP
jgi:GT2 family glycosyltransferase